MSIDTIYALATGQGGAIAVVRLGGPEAIAVAERMFRPASGGPLSSREGYTISLGHIVDGAGEVVDQVLVSLFRAPRSYTGEDMVEISAHGSPYITRRILELCSAAGARMAEPGEFTLRAFLAGKMDLTQAEAVADLIASSDRASHALATTQLRGGYSSIFADMRAELLRLASLVELELDFSQEDVAFADRAELTEVIERLERATATLADSFATGNALKEGIPVVIAGEPNVGKSTLLNALVKEERAMVSDIPGTTRDVIEESVVLGGVRFRFLDTAGLRESDDRLEQMGIERTRASISRARMILWMADAAQWLADPAAFAVPPFEVREEQRLFLVLNKADRLSAEEVAKLNAMEGIIERAGIRGRAGIEVGSRAVETSSHDAYESSSWDASEISSGNASNSLGNTSETFSDDTSNSLKNTSETSFYNLFATGFRQDPSQQAQYPASHPATTLRQAQCPAGQIRQHTSLAPATLICAKTGINIEGVKDILERSVELAPLLAGDATIVSAARHRDALLLAREALVRAREAIACDLPPDLLAEELRGALYHLGTITGEITNDEILGEIFSKFCIGK